jgi:hypothetical protein
MGPFFYSVRLKKGLEVFPFVPQIRVTSDKHVVHCAKLCDLNELTGSD